MLGTYRHDLWYRAPQRAGLSESNPKQVTTYSYHYRPEQYLALEYLTKWYNDSDSDYSDANCDPTLLEQLRKKAHLMGEDEARQSEQAELGITEGRQDIIATYPADAIKVRAAPTMTTTTTERTTCLAARTDPKAE